MTEQKVIAGNKVVSQKSEADELAKLINKTVRELKKGQFSLKEEVYPDLFRFDLYHKLRDEYRHLMLLVENFPDEDPLKIAAFEFFEKVLKNREGFDASIILPLVYQKMTPKSADLLCNCADEIGENGIGGIVYIAMKNFQEESAHYNVLKGTQEPYSEEELKLIAKVAKKYSKFVQ